MTRATPRDGQPKCENGSGGDLLLLFYHGTSGEIDNLPKSLRIAHRNSGQSLSVQLDLGTLEPGDQFAIARAPRSARGIHTDDPQPAKHPLPHPAIAERELPGPDQRDHRLPIQVMPAQ